MGSFAGYFQDHLTNSLKPCVRVSDPGAPGKMDIKLAFLLEKSVVIFLPET